MDYRLQAASSSMTFVPLFQDDADFYLTQASKYIAKAASEFREKGDHAYATLLLDRMHTLHRPEYLPAPAQEPVLPQLPPALSLKTTGTPMIHLKPFRWVYEVAIRRLAEAGQPNLSPLLITFEQHGDHWRPTAAA